MKPQFTLIFCASHLWLFSSRSCNKNWQTLLDTSVKTCFESVQVTRGGVPASLSTAGLRPASLSYLSCRHLHAHMHTHTHTHQARMHGVETTRPTWCCEKTTGSKQTSIMWSSVWAVWVLYLHISFSLHYGWATTGLSGESIYRNLELLTENI